MRKVFISYRALDAQLSLALADCVTSSGALVYLDQRDPALDTISVDGIEQRQPVMKAIRAGLQSADTLVAVITRLARGSWWIPAELALALAMGKEVVAVCETDVRPPDFDIHHLIRDGAEFRAWLSGLGSGSLNEERFRQFSQALFKPASNSLRLASETAIEKIEALWDPESWNGLVLDDPRYAYRGDWIGCRTDTLISTLRAIATPVYLYTRETRLDRSELEREVASLLFSSWIDEESLAAITPEILYEARKCTDWRRLRDNDPARYWLQGMKSKDLNRLFDEMSGTNGEVISGQAFRQKFLERAGLTGDTQKPLGLAANPLQGFTLAKRPVFARVMAVHLRVHHALLLLDSAGGVGRSSLEKLFDLPVTSAVRGTASETASLTYLTGPMSQRLRPLLWEESWAQLAPA